MSTWLLEAHWSNGDFESQSFRNSIQILTRPTYEHEHIRIRLLKRIQDRKYIFPPWLDQDQEGLNFGEKIRLLSLSFVHFCCLLVHCCLNGEGEKLHSAHLKLKSFMLIFHQQRELIPHKGNTSLTFTPMLQKYPSLKWVEHSIKKFIA